MMHLSSEILIDEDRIAERVDVMARAISADTPEGAPLSVIVALDGAFVFCADLVRRLPMPVRLCMLPLTSVRRGGDPSKAVFPPDFPLKGEDVLVIEDILDTGRTLAELRTRLDFEEPRRVRLAVLLDKPARRQVPIEADYAGFTVADRWVVGYGLDYEGLYRNLPYVTYVERRVDPARS
jgi:hypoxanthine phosphoribosyltransferase